jgi:hypothetical protein
VAESKEKHGVWDPIPELAIITSPYVHSRVDSSTLTMGNPMTESTLTRADFIPQSGTLDLASEHLLKTYGTERGDYRMRVPSVRGLAFTR